MTEDDGLRLQSNSPAKNKGINTKASITDISGITRPRGLNSDIGAYEFVE